MSAKEIQAWEGGFNASALTKRPRYYQEMQPVPFPRRRYFPPGAAAAIGVILNAARLTTFGADLLNVDHIIWGSAALGGIVVGFLSADLSTSSSALRRWIRYRTRLFDVLAVWPLYESLRNRDYFMVSLRFVVRLDGASAILRLKSSGAAQHETAIDLVQNLTRAKDLNYDSRSLLSNTGAQTT